jgi:Dyp-type peroxidase family
MFSRAGVRFLPRNNSKLFSTKVAWGKRTNFSNFGKLAIPAVAAGASLIYFWSQKNEFAKCIVDTATAPFVAKAATTPTPQPNVYSQGKEHALYLWINLKTEADRKQVAKVFAKLQKFVDEVCPADMRDETDEIWAGVGFSSNFYTQMSGEKTQKQFHYPHRKGVLGEMPSTGGDIFVHAKSNQVSKLFELAQVLQKNLPKNSVQSFNDIYSFTYRNGRDLSGFIDGTENRADEEGRFEVAVEKTTGGSYCITQKWVHDMNFIGIEKDPVLEGIVGRSRPDSTELKRKPATSHVARMTSGTEFNAKKPVEMVRQSMPYGTVGGESGLFFIGFAESPANFEYMLDRMVGATADGLSDDIMRLARCVSGNYWYFPSVEELKKFS